MTQATDAADLRTALRGSAARRRRERTVRAILLSAGLASVGISAFIVVTLIVDALRFLAAVDLERPEFGRLVPTPRAVRPPDAPHRDVPRVGHRDARRHPDRPASARSTSPSTPRPARASIVKPILEILAGIPSVVLGFFALTVISPDVVQPIFPQASGLQPRSRRASASAS